MIARDFVLTTLFSAGDVVPFVRLGTQLRARGHRVTLVTHAPFRELALEAGLAFDTWDTPAEHAAMMADGHLFDDLVGFEQIYERYVIPKLAREADALRRHCTSDTVLVTRCGPALAARAVAEQRGSTLVEAYLGPGHASPTAVVEELSRPWQAQIAAVRSGNGDVASWLAACDARLGLWPAWFAAPESHWPPGLELVGFTAAEDGPPLAPDVDELLAGERPRVLLACGTGRFLTKDVVAVCAAAVASAGGSLLVVTPFADLVPAGVTRIASAPYATLFSRVDLVIHHGGIGTVTQALRAGIPQIALGAGGDRPINARCLQRLGVGRYVPPASWSEPAISAALASLLGSTEVRDACTRFADLARADRERAADVLERADRTTRDATSPRTHAAPVSLAQRALMLKRLRERDR